MPTVAGIKIKTKTTKPRNPLFADEKYTGSEPEWPSGAEEWPSEEFDHLLRKSFYYYNYFYEQKDCKPHFIEWMKSSQFDRDVVRIVEKSSDKMLPMTACSLIMAHRRGMPLLPRHIEFLTKTIDRIVDRDDPDVVEQTKTATPEQVALRPTIQDRLNEKTSEQLGEFEGELDNIYQKKDSKFKAYDYLTANNVPQSQLNKFESVFRKHRNELESAQSKQDEQLVEGYKFLKSADFKRIIGWIDQVLSDIEQYRGVKKATKKVKAKKAPSKDKLVSKLKYAKEDKTLKVVSINPADIIGASELWIYNNKTRKLGKYVAASYQTLTVKGTSIVGYDTDKSVSKTLRKPEEQLKDFAKAGKVALRTYLKDIKAVEVKLNGRIGPDVLLLKVA